MASSSGSVFLAALTVIVLGYVLRKSGLLTREHGGVLAKIVLNVTLPALVIRTVPDIEFAPSLLFLPFLAIGHAVAAYALVRLVFHRRSRKDQALIAICSMGFNNGLFAFPIIYEIWGLSAVQLMAVFDVGNGLVIIGANYVIAAQAAAPEGHVNLASTLRQIGKTLVTSVPMLAFFFALMLNVTGVRLPGVLDRTVNMLADANGALALLVLGVFQSLRLQRGDLRFITPVLVLRYALGIAFVIATVTLLGTQIEYRRVLSVAFILPIGMTVIPYSVQFRLNTHLASTMVNITILMSFVLMWVAVSVVG